MADSENEHWWDLVFDRNREVTGYAGLTEAEATEQGRARGYGVRVFRTEWKVALTSERAEGRLNLLVDAEGRVIRAAEF